MRPSGRARNRHFAEGHSQSQRRIQHYRPEQNKLLYTIDNITVERVAEDEIELFDLADSAYQRICG